MRLIREPRDPHAFLALTPEVQLARGRAHEVTGPARHVLALLAGAHLDGPILWLHPSWTPERLNADGAQPYLNPGRIVFAAVRHATDILWAAEEALRSGTVPLVVAELLEPPALTPVRRLHLAAEAGTGPGAAPIMLLLTPGEGGAPGIETRWHITPAPWSRDGRAHWRLTRTRARTAPVAQWDMRLKDGRMALSPRAKPAQELQDGASGDLSFPVGAPAKAAAARSDGRPGSSRPPVTEDGEPGTSIPGPPRPTAVRSPNPNRAARRAVPTGR